MDRGLTAHARGLQGGGKVNGTTSGSIVFPTELEISYVCGNGSTEANLWALWLARERLSAGDCVGDPLLLYSEQIHYSVPKVANILRFRAQAVPVNGEGP